MLDNINNSDRIQFKPFLVFLSVIVVMIGIMTGLLIPAKKNWKEQLAVSCEKVLSQSSVESYKNLKCGDYVELNSLLSTSTACYKAVKKHREVKDCYILITRVTTFYGPQAAVFVYNGDSMTEFIGFAELSGPVADAVGQKDQDTVIKYWCYKLNNLIQTKVFDKKGDGK